jgi:autophagy-related protein 33
MGPETTTTAVAAKMQRKRERRGKMEASYEVLGDSHSEGTSEGDEVDEEVNGEEVRTAMEGFKLSQSVRLALSGLAFAMSVVGIWGDGA